MTPARERARLGGHTGKPSWRSFWAIGRGLPLRPGGNQRRHLRPLAAAEHPANLLGGETPCGESLDEPFSGVTTERCGAAGLKVADQ